MVILKGRTTKLEQLAEALTAPSFIALSTLEDGAGHFLPLDAFIRHARDPIQVTFQTRQGSLVIEYMLQKEKTCYKGRIGVKSDATAWVSLDKIEDKPDEKFYRIQANLNSPVSLKNFPFDEQQMQIILEDKKSTVDDLVYIPLDEESGIDDSIAFTGWNIKGWSGEVKEHYYPVYDETYSQYVFSINIAKIVFNSFLKTFLPVVFIMLVVLFSFLLDPDKVQARLGMVGSSLVASVMFHVSISNQIPPVGYLTFADKFMLLTYFVLLASFIINIAMLELQQLKKNEMVEKMHKYTKYPVFIVVLLLYFNLFLFFV